MKNVKSLTAIFAASTALLTGCDLTTASDRYAFDCLHVGEAKLSVGTLRVTMFP